MTTATPPPMSVRRFRFTREQYREITARGFFDGRTVELIFGLVLEREPIDDRRSMSGGRTTDLLRRAFNGVAVVGRVSPTDLPDSDPRPDVSVIREVTTNSTPTLLVVEITVDALHFNLTTKAELYATAGVPEYWVLDVDGRQLHVLSDPGPLPLPTELAAVAYRSQRVLSPTDRVSPLGAPHASILVSDLLP